MNSEDVMICIGVGVICLILGLIFGSVFSIPTDFELEGKECFLYAHEIYCKHVEVTE